MSELFPGPSGSSVEYYMVSKVIDQPFKGFSTLHFSWGTSVTF